MFVGGGMQETSITDVDADVLYALGHGT